MVTYITRAKDMLDAICFRYYGDSQRFTEAVREANPDLAKFGPVLPAGLPIELPDLENLRIKPNTIRLWD